MQEPLWQRTLGRVAFLNCDPLYLDLDDHWNILSAPPAWLTGHLLRKDCIVAPIPAADWVLHRSSLDILDGIGIISDGDVGSVLLFGEREMEDMRDVALPTDSATSRRLLMYLLSRKGLDPRPVEMAPDLESMLERCDGALLIGDRALHEAQRNPGLIRMDLGRAWKEETGAPMVFGVFAAHKDAPDEQVKLIQSNLIDQKVAFLDPKRRESIIERCSAGSGFTRSRVKQYFNEVLFDLDADARRGLELFSRHVMGVSETPLFLQP